MKGLDALLAVLSTPLAAPVIAATRLRHGATDSVRGAARLLADALAMARRAGATGFVIVRADSAYYGYDIIDACYRAGARFFVTARLTPPWPGHHHLAERHYPSVCAAQQGALDHPDRVPGVLG